MLVCIHMHVHICIEREREGEIERDRQTDRERERERESMYTPLRGTTRYLVALMCPLVKTSTTSPCYSHMNRPVSHMRGHVTYMQKKYVYVTHEKEVCRTRDSHNTNMWKTSHRYFVVDVPVYRVHVYVFIYTYVYIHRKYCVVEPPFFKDRSTLSTATQGHTQISAINLRMARIFVLKICQLCFGLRCVPNQYGKKLGLK